GRAGIDGEAVAAVERGDRGEIGRQQRARIVIERGGVPSWSRLLRRTRVAGRCAEQPAGTGAPFAGAARLRAGAVRAAGAGRGRGRLLAQVQQDAHQDGMLDDIGETAGVEGVAVVHGAWRTVMARSKQRIASSEWKRSRARLPYSPIRYSPFALFAIRCLHSP